MFRSNPNQITLNELIMKRDFEKFLTRNRDYRRYFRNLKLHFGDEWEAEYHHLLSEPENLIADAFWWNLSPEGGEHWVLVYNLWDKQLEKIRSRNE